MKTLFRRTLRPLIVLFSFSLGYIVSLFFAYVLFLPENFKSLGSYNFFKDNWLIALTGVLVICFGFIVLKLVRYSFSYVSILELGKLSIVNICVLIANLIIRLSQSTYMGFRHVVVIFFMYFVVSFDIIFAYKFLKVSLRWLRKNSKNVSRVLIVGAGDAGTMILREITSSDKINVKVVGFIDNDPNKLGSSICGAIVLGTTDEIPKLVAKYRVSKIIIALPSQSMQVIKEISNICVSTKCEVKVLPSLYQLLSGKVSISRLRDVDVNDLLGREPVVTNIDEIMSYIEGKVVLVTGGGGSIGSELCRQLATHNPRQLIILDIYENNAYDIEQELKRNVPSLNLLTLIASVRDSHRMDDIFNKYRPQIVFHAAAHKHVPLMETSPNEAVKNNIIGTYKVVKCADKYGVEKFIQISTDKAVNPTNIMGASKRVCEMIIQYYAKISKTTFVAVRFGNVLGSNGSVIPLFKKQIAAGGPVTVTHKDIIRYFMTIPEAVSLILQAGAYAKGGEIFVLDMGEQVRIYDLAVNLIRLSGLEPGKDIEIKITGLRPGEKLYEERLMEEEGLTKTANGKINIGKPIEFDENKLVEILDKLYDEAYSESDEIKYLVKELVPTYKVYEGKLQ